jgi:hypothetical protein
MTQPQCGALPDRNCGSAAPTMPGAKRLAGEGIGPTQGQQNHRNVPKHNDGSPVSNITPSGYTTEHGQRPTCALELAGKGPDTE